MSAAELTARRFDVVVVGARCAGAATALLLARSGLDVLVLDRSRYGSDTISTHGLVRGGVLQLRRWGLLDRLVEAGATFHFGTTVTDLVRDAAGGVRGVVARVHDGYPIEIAAGLVVGADGLRSLVADRVAAPAERTGTGASGFLYGPRLRRPARIPAPGVRRRLGTRRRRRLLEGPDRNARNHRRVP